MTEFADLHFSAAFLERHALPDIGYPVPLARFLDLVGTTDALDFAELLYWLQQQSSEAGRDFRQYEPAMARLAQLLAPEDDASDTASVQGNEWWMELGPVDLDAEIVTSRYRARPALRTLAARSRRAEAGLSQIGRR
jgi:hypothetical protein